MSTSKRKREPRSRSSSGSGLLYKALGPSAAIVAVTALPSFAVGSDPFEIDSVPEDETEGLDGESSSMPEGFEDAEPKSLDEIDSDSEGVFEIIDPDSEETESLLDDVSEPDVVDDGPSDKEVGADDEADTDDIDDDVDEKIDGDATEDDEDEGASDEARVDG